MPNVRNRETTAEPVSQKSIQTENVEAKTVVGLVTRLDRMEHVLNDIQAMLAGSNPGPEWLTTSEFAEAVGKSEFTIRQACNLGRIQAEKTPNQRSWRINRTELLRYRKEGLLPLQAK